MDKILELLKREKDYYEEIFEDTGEIMGGIRREDFRSTVRLMRRRKKICDEIQRCEESLDVILGADGAGERYELYRRSRKVRDIVDGIEEILRKVSLSDREMRGSLAVMKEGRMKNLENLAKGKSLLKKYKPYRERRSKFFDRLK